MIERLQEAVIRRAGKDIIKKEGDPFDYIPVQNRKGAKETEELHLGNRGFETLVNFQYFVNLEILWLNGNNLTKLEGLDSNTRIKELYIQNNNLRTLEGSISKMKHLVALTAYNNQLSNLKKNIDFLSDFHYLSHLELYNNPLSEEPNYKKLIIYNLKNLILFDRHTIKDSERQDAAKLCAPKNGGNVKKRPKFKKPHESYSLNETLVLKAAKKIRKEKEENETYERELAMGLRTTKLAAPVPKRPPLNEVMINLEKEETITKFEISEYEKGLFLPLFKGFGENKDRKIKLQEIPSIFEKISQDEISLGKVPDITPDEALELSKPRADIDGWITWIAFRDLLGDIPWRPIKYSEVSDRIDNIYKEAQELYHSDKHQECLEKVLDALKIEKHFVDKNN